MSREEEEWREVPSDPGILVSSWGRIMVKPWVKSLPNGGTRVYGGKPTLGVRAFNAAGTQSRRLFCRRGHKTRKVHRLVCEAFHGPAPKGMNVCMHIDENAENNRPENLRWGTQKENLQSPGFLQYASMVCRQKMAGMKLK